MAQANTEPNARSLNRSGLSGVRYDSAEMARRGRIGALVTLSRHDPAAQTAAARARFKAQFAEEAKAAAAAGGEEISDAEAARRGEAARRAFYARLTHASVRARSRRAPTPEAA